MLKTVQSSGYWEAITQSLNWVHYWYVWYLSKILMEQYENNPEDNGADSSEYFKPRRLEDGVIEIVPLPETSDSNIPGSSKTMSTQLEPSQAVNPTLTFGMYKGT